MSKALTYEQGEKLSQRLENAGVSHGAEGQLDLDQVVLIPAQRSSGAMHGYHVAFCNSLPENLRASEGDGSPLSEEAVLLGELPEDLDGCGALRNLAFSTNGRVALRVTPETRFEFDKAKEKVPA